MLQTAFSKQFLSMPIFANLSISVLFDPNEEVFEENTVLA